MSVSRSRSRSPLFSPSETPSKKAGAFEIPEPDSAESVYDESNYEDVLRLVILNFPLGWEFETLKDFLLTQCQSVVEENQLPLIIRRKTTRVILKFQSSIPCFTCYKKLCDVEIEGNKLKIEPIRNVPREIKSAKGELKKKAMYQSSSRPKFLTMTTYTSNPNETYGLSLSFLSSLGIKPPLKNTLYVGSLSPAVDKEKLTEVFSLAGRVVNIIMLGNNNGAKVEYDHAVEAVQAISMFNRQCLMGRPMYVQFDLHKYTITMPVGLQSLGPGLGKDGEPLRDIRQLVEIQPLKEKLSKELAELKAAKTKELAQASSAMMNANTTSALGSRQNIMTPLNINTMGMNPLNPAAAVFGLNVPGQQNIQSWQGLLQQNIGNDLASTLAALQAHSNTTGTTAASTLGALQVHTNTSGKTGASTLAALQVHNNTSGHTNAGFGQALSVGQTNEKLRTSSTNNGSSESKSYSQTQSKSQSQSKSKYTDDRKDDNDKNLLTSSDMLVFNYLPSSVTVQALNNKMSEIGDLVFAEITGKGRAIVRFRNNQDAERCIKLFDRSKVDGQTIEVKFF